MRKLLTPLCLLFSTVLFFASCLDTDSDEVVLYSDCAVVSFSVSTAPIYVYKTTAEGKDTSYVTHGNSMTTYAFTIDHQKGLIYNEDSLPQHTDATRLVCNYSTKNNGILAIQNIDSDTLKFFSTSDSTDFSKPRLVKVFSSDGMASRTYTITVNIHQEDADSFQWKAQAAHPDFAAMQAVKTYVVGEAQVVAGEKDGNTLMYVANTAADNSWTAVGKTFGAEAWKNIVVKGDSLYVLDGTKLYSVSSGDLLASADGSCFNNPIETSGVKQIVGACSTELYAFGNDGAILVSLDGGNVWAKDSLGDDASLLPTMDIASQCYVINPQQDYEYVLLVGNRNIADHPEDNGAVVWRKVVDPEGINKWVYVGGIEKELYSLPKMSNLSVFYYDESILACGGPTIDSSASANYTKFYQSRDGGITWKTVNSFAFPEAFNTSATMCAAASDSQNFIRLVAAGTGEVWRGRVNRLGWQK